MYFERRSDVKDRSCPRLNLETLSISMVRGGPLTAKNTRIMLVVGVGFDLEGMASRGTVDCIWPGVWLCFQFKICLETTLPGTYYSHQTWPIFLFVHRGVCIL